MKAADANAEAATNPDEELPDIDTLLAEFEIDLDAIEAGASESEQVGPSEQGAILSMRFCLGKTMWTSIHSWPVEHSRN